MVIGTIFQFGNEVIEVRIQGEDCFFRSQSYGAAYTQIDGLKLDDAGIIKEFPELKELDRLERKIEAIRRFKEKLKGFKTEDERMNYVIEDLKKYGYVPLYQQKKGFRPKKL